MLRISLSCASKSRGGAAALAEAGVGTDVHYPVPDHLQNAWSSERWRTLLCLTRKRAAAKC